MCVVSCTQPQQEVQSPSRKVDTFVSPLGFNLLSFLPSWPHCLFPSLPPAHFALPLGLGAARAAVVPKLLSISLCEGHFLTRERKRRALPEREKEVGEEREIITVNKAQSGVLIAKHIF